MVFFVCLDGVSADIISKLRCETLNKCRSTACLMMLPKRIKMDPDLAAKIGGLVGIHPIRKSQMKYYQEHDLMGKLYYSTNF